MLYKALDVNEPAIQPGSGYNVFDEINRSMPGGAVIGRPTNPIMHTMEPRVMSSPTAAMFGAQPQNNSVGGNRGWNWQMILPTPTHQMLNLFGQQQPNSYTQQQPNSYTQQQPNSYTQQQPNPYTQQQPNPYTQQQPNPYARPVGMF